MDMMIPPVPIGTEYSSHESCSDRELLLEILKSISRLEGMIMMQGNKASTPNIGIPPIASAQLDFPPIMF